MIVHLVPLLTLWIPRRQCNRKSHLHTEVREDKNSDDERGVQARHMLTLLSHFIIAATIRRTHCDGPYIELAHSIGPVMPSCADHDVTFYDRVTPALE